MVAKKSKRTRILFLFLAILFFSVTLFSGEIIVALVKSNLLSLEFERITDAGKGKNRKAIANQQLEEVTSNLNNAENLLLTSNQRTCLH